VKLLRPVGRALIGAAFVSLGRDVVGSPGGRVERAAPTLAAIRSVVPLPEDDEMLVRLNAAAQMAAGAALALGIAPRLAAFVLVGSLVPTTHAGHRFWTIEDPAQRRTQQTQFAKNAAMLGGLLLELAGRGD
jgi:uncharacterized membrane protein YphA (DoxX/SURF4 family)